MSRTRPSVSSTTSAIGEQGGQALAVVAGAGHLVGVDPLGGRVLGSLVIACLPAGGPGRNRWIAACPGLLASVGNGAAVRVEFDAGDWGRR